jgi:ATP diphosphatase
MTEIDELVTIMKTLRDPETGCPWDLEQNFASILPYSIEEIYELAAAIDEYDPDAIRDELGDILFHIVFYARLAEESGQFDLAAVARGINEKLRRRHPHVFGESAAGTPAMQGDTWERIKREERQSGNSAGSRSRGLLDGIGQAMPAVIRAVKLQQRAATAGFDWSEKAPVLAKLEEEIAELRQEIESGADREQVTDELGDVMFSCINLARHCQVDPENALRLANGKFEQRFRYIETQLNDRNQTLDETGLDEMEALWHEAKKIEEGPRSD